MRTTLPVVLAVLIGLSGILGAGGFAIMKTYAPSGSTTQIGHQTNTPTPSASNNSPAQPSPATVKLTQQPQNNQTCTGEDCPNEQGDD